MQAPFWKNAWVRRAALAMLLLVYFAVVFWVFGRLGIGCVFQHFLGIPCPGCGMTRAALALARADFAAAFSYHPLIFAMPYVLVYLFFELKPAHVHRRILLGIGIAALVHWALVLFQH